MKRSSQYIVSGVLSICLLLFVAACHKSLPEESPAADRASAAQDISSADQLYAQRADLGQLRRGIISLRQALTKDPGNYEAAWKLSKFNYYLATHTADAKERDEAFRAGIDAGKTAVQLQNDKPDGHFWLGANYGGAAEQSSIQGLATVNDIRHEMETVLRLDQGYQDGSAYMVLGLVDLDAPGIVGGDPKKAVEEMEQGLRFGEPNAFLHLHLAEAYKKVGRNDDARKELKNILSMTPDPNYLPEYKEASAAAQKLLDQIDHGS
ncbi:MAG TPA: TRAP transporter TatT component family protein [Pyrinomonadaceae bacterium]|jgi:Tfp pilus assembly protein PilF|nr:TRAP transporter TatT component family protein [Pyrinomonadaceae bacterium]